MDTPTWGMPATTLLVPSRGSTTQVYPAVPGSAPHSSEMIPKSGCAARRTARMVASAAWSASVTRSAPRFSRAARSCPKRLRIIAPPARAA
jgi:hypothetical protein